MKKMLFVFLRLLLSVFVVLKKRPALLKRDSSAAKPPAIVAMAASCCLSSSVNYLGMSISAPPHNSCSMGEALPITPKPITIIQNWWR